MRRRRDQARQTERLARTRQAIARPVVRAVLGAVAVAVMPCTSAAAESVSAKMRFSPARLGSATTIFASLSFAGSDGELPAPLTGLELQLPTGMAFTSSSLGLAFCHPAALLDPASPGCPANARLGLGRASVAVPLGPRVVRETTNLIVFNGPQETDRTPILIYAVGRQPVIAEVLIDGELTTAARDEETTLVKSSVPLIGTVPGGGDVAITQLAVSMGPRGLTYLERRHGTEVAFHPRGLLIPGRCPAGGFRFGVGAVFADGAAPTFRGRIPCP